jgi:putative tricarboxylic transport membrane protein
MKTAGAHMKTGRALLALGLLGAGASGWCQGWTPQRGVEIVVGFAPGGGVDRTARAMERILTANKLINVGVSVVNKPGGNTNIAYAYTYQRAPDPHTLMVFGQMIFTNHITGASALGYTDFTPIASLFNEYHVYVVAANTPVKTGKDLEKEYADTKAALADLGMAK